MQSTLFNELLASVKEAGAIKRNEVLPSREMELKMEITSFGIYDLYNKVNINIPFKNRLRILYGRSGTYKSSYLSKLGYILENKYIITKINEHPPLSKITIGVDNTIHEFTNSRVSNTTFKKYFNIDYKCFYYNQEFPFISDTTISSIQHYGSKVPKSFLEIVNKYLKKNGKEISCSIIDPFVSDGENKRHYLKVVDRKCDYELALLSLSASERKIVKIFFDLLVCNLDKDYVVIIDNPENHLPIFLAFRLNI